MLSKNRPGLFQGRSYNRDEWVVVNPTAPDPLAVQEEWERSHRGTSDFLSPRPVRSVLAWVAALAIIAGGVWLGFVLSDRFGWVLGAIALFASLALGAVAAAAIHGWFTDRHPHPALSSEFDELSPFVRRWADDSTEIAVIWSIQKYVSDLSELEYLHSESLRFEPFLRAEYERVLGEFQQLAQRTGFSIPHRLLSLDTPTAD